MEDYRHNFCKFMCNLWHYFGVYHCGPLSQVLFGVSQVLFGGGQVLFGASMEFRDLKNYHGFVWKMPTCKCGHSFANNFNLQRHLSSKTHKMNMLCAGDHIITSDEKGMYVCETCNYSTEFKGNFRKHVLSEKHKRQTTPFISNDNEIKPGMLMELITTMMKQQHELQMNMVNKFVSSPSIERSIEHPNVLTDIQQQTVIATDCNNITNSHNTTNNQKFNLNLFLNEECKNAMNINEFIQSVVITSEDLEHLGEVGYTDGMSKILTKAMRGIETTERPMHCTDVKRETIYVRKDDAWKKDDDSEETKRLIQHIAHKNYKALMEWRNEHPEHAEPDTADYEAWYSISRNMCNTDPSALKKLIRHLALTTAVEKNKLIT